MKKNSFLLGTLVCCALGMTSCATNELATEAYQQQVSLAAASTVSVTESQTPIQEDNQAETQTSDANVVSEEKTVALNSEGENTMDAENQVTENQEISNEETSTSEQVNNQSEDQEADGEVASVSYEVAESAYIAYQKGNVITIIAGTSCPTNNVATPTPKVTCAPNATDSATETPTVTKQPSATETPTATKQPSVTETPAATKQPSETKTPTATKQPSATKTPTATKQPEATKAPVATQAPTVTPEATKSPTGDSSNESVSSYASQVLALINEERANAGLSALTTTTALSNAADKRAQEIVSTFSHTRPDGTSGVTVLKEYSISYMAWGENIAYGQKTPAAVMEAWMNSSGHRANILSSKFGKVGIGCYEKNGVLYWTQVFTN